MSANQSCEVFAVRAKPQRARRASNRGSFRKGSHWDRPAEISDERHERCRPCPAKRTLLLFRRGRRAREPWHTAVLARKLHRSRQCVLLARFIVVERHAGKFHSDLRRATHREMEFSRL